MWPCKADHNDLLVPPENKLPSYSILCASNRYINSHVGSSGGKGH